MVAGHHNFMREVEGVQGLEELEEVFFTAVPGEIPRVDEDIPLNLFVHHSLEDGKIGVRVGDGHYLESALHLQL